MSQAFIRESDDQWLSDIPPTMQALCLFLTKENNGIRVQEKRSFVDKTGTEIFEMTNGARYFRNAQGCWEVYLK